MCGKSKCICAFLVGIVSLCLLSACTVNGNDMDMESPKENDSVEHESSSGTLPSKIDNAGQQVTESTGNEQSSDTASKQDEEISSGMEESYKAILLGDEDFVNIWSNWLNHGERRLNIENIKEVVSEEDWVTAKVTKFTIIDLDGSGENELILWIQANGHSDYGYEILFYQDQEVYGFTLPYRAFQDLKTDGTFYSSGNMDDRGIRRLQFSERGYTYEDASDSEFQASKQDVEWYDLTEDNVELIFENK